MMTRKEFGALGLGFGLAVGVSLAGASLAGLQHRSTVGALPPQHPTSPPATVQPSRPAAPPVSPSPSPSQPSGAQHGADAQRLVPGPQVGQRPTAPSPSPSPTRAGGCGGAQIITVSLPVSGLPCGTVRVTRVARVGGTR